MCVLIKLNTHPMIMDLPTYQLGEIRPVASSTVIPPSLFGVSANIPSYLHRAGFGAIYGGAAYVLSTGDIRNGSGITTGIRKRGVHLIMP
jgi:hypothetical protein